MAHLLSFFYLPPYKCVSVCLCAGIHVYFPIPHNFSFDPSPRDKRLVGFVGLCTHTAWKIGQFPDYRGDASLQADKPLILSFSLNKFLNMWNIKQLHSQKAKQIGKIINMFQKTLLKISVMEW